MRSIALALSFVVLLITSACAAKPSTRAPAQRGPARPEAGSDDARRGRLRTAPGLCEIVGNSEDADADVEESTDPSQGPQRASLQLEYDVAGRLAKAESSVTDGRGVSTCGPWPQTNEVRWKWDAAGRLIEVEHRVAIVSDPRDPVENPKPECACLVHEGDEMHLLERSTWTWADDGELIGSSTLWTDCEDTERTEEKLHRIDGGVRSTRVMNGVRDVQDYRLDAAGRVLEVVGLSRHRYDAVGRLVESRGKDGSITRFSYTVPALGTAASPSRWREIATEDSLVLVEAEERRIEIVFDEQRRPIAVANDDDMLWEFHYGGCPNADRASARWWLDALLLWSWPDVPSAGDAHGSLRGWTEEDLPLSAY